jgi:PAS domain S-box-containing protein
MSPQQSPHRNQKKDLKAENENLRAQLAEAREMLQAIQSGEVDAMVVNGPSGDQIFTLKGADYSYRILVQEMHEAATILSEDGTILFCNRYFSELLKVPQEKIGGTPLEEYVFRDDRKVLRQFLKNPDSWDREGEVRFQSRDGVIIPMALSMTYVRDACGICMVATDLSRHKRIEERLRAEYEATQDLLLQRNEELAVAEETLQKQNEELMSATAELRAINEELKQNEATLRETGQYLENLIGSASAPIIVWNPQYRITRFNHAAEILTGKPASSMLGQNVETLFPEDRREEIVISLIQPAMKGKNWKGIEIPILNEKGAVKTVLWNSAIVMGSDGNIRSTIVQGQDITERKRMEIEVKDMADKYSSLFNSTSDGIWIHNLAGNIVEVNDAYCQMSGYTSEELLGKPMSMLEAKETKEEVQAHTRKVIESGGHDRFESRHRRKDGSIFDVDVTALYLPRKEGRIAVFCRDITDRRHANEELKQYAERLKRSNEDLERFAYIASHDLQEPLRNVVSFSQLLARRYSGKLEPDADEFIGYIVEGGRRLQALVSDLLEYSRVNTRASPFQKTNSEEVVDRVIQNLFFTIQESNTTIETTPLPTVNADSGQLGMIFQNLIANAIKFCREEPPYIHISAEKSGYMWKFAVRDNGIGIDPAFNNRIFEIFQRLHTRDKYPGTGVGLAIVKKIIERHGGNIWVESEVGRGSTFYFTLPAA